MTHAPGFLKLVNDAKTRIHEISVEEAKRKVGAGGSTVLLDVREDHEWNTGHAVEAIHLGKGIFERDLERTVPDPAVEILMYCGGGFRSALTCDAAQRMGYAKVYSIAGGYKAMVAAGWPMTPAT